MSTSPNIPFPLPLRQTVLHDRVERLGLALGASRERTFRAGLISVPNENSLDTATDRWENEGGVASSALATPSFTIARKTGGFRLSADLFRDDTLTRAVVINSSLVLIAATILVLAYN